MLKEDPVKQKVMIVTNNKENRDFVPFVHYS